jgi:LacI family transcriptional regulator
VPGKAHVTIQDIARKAGVGVGTVSRVLNDAPNVNPQTRQLVQAIMAEVGYRPRTAAQTLRTHKTHEIGFITDEIASTPFAVDVIRGAQDAAWAHGKILILINTNRNPDVLHAALETMLERQVEGIIYAAMFHQPVQLPITVCELPAVLVDCYVEDRTLPSVVPDEVTAGRLATATLIERGHRRIGFINNNEATPAAVGRLAGYRQALAEAGIPFDPLLLCPEASDPDGGYRSVQRLRQQPDPPTAIFCFNDRMAMGAYAALRDLKLAIPHDVAVLGFDNQEIIAANLRPGLTTMQLPHYAMGQWAIQYLVGEASEAENSHPPQVQLACPLVLRESV